MTRERIYTLIIDENGIPHILKRKVMDDEINHKLNLIYRYVDALEDLAYENRQRLDSILKNQSKEEGFDITMDDVATVEF